MRHVRTVPVLSLGPGARAALIGPALGRIGTVLAVFRRSFYVECGAGALACLGPPGLGAGPLNALCDLPPEWDWPAAGLAPGMALLAEPGGVSVERHWRFDLAGARDWRPAPLLAPQPGRGDSTPFGALGRADFAPRGLATLLPEVLSPGVLGSAAQDGANAAPADPVQARVLARVLSIARTALDDLREWLQGDPALPVPGSLIALVGMGPGLTPAGDDLLGGALIALRGVRQTERAARLAAAVLPVAARCTGRISAAHLAWAARGLGAAALHDVLAAVWAGADDRLSDALRCLDGIGHTSGWDALAGALAAWAFLPWEGAAAPAALPVAPQLAMPHVPPSRPTAPGRRPPC